MSSDGAALSSIASSLDDLTRRVTGIAERYQDTARDDVAVTLFEAERALVSARRRIEKVGHLLT